MKLLALYLGLLMELIRVLIMVNFIIPIMENLLAYCLVIRFDKMMDVSLVLQMGFFIA